MTEKVHNHPNLIYSVGTKVVIRKPVQSANGKVAHPAGAVGVIIKSPMDRTHTYRVMFLDGVETSLHHDNLMQLAEYKEGDIFNTEGTLAQHGLFDRVIFRCVIGSRAYGLESDDSDTDRRGIYLPPANLHWSLYGVPKQLECDETQEVYWELQKFLILALKANPNVLECLYSPIIETATPLAEELLAMKEIFLSRLVYQTYNGYVMSQFKKMQTDIRNQGKVKWKHVMHLIRILLSGIHVLKEGFVKVQVDEHREQLLAIRQEELPWEETEKWRKSLHKEFDDALKTTTLPDRPNYEKANAFLIKARQAATKG